ncbi:MAG TPA: preprotein translocase subunit SecA [Gammaproteobacteria bacterium]|nr:preprotein translocase subunit SecA [Gammaproteobacteria bacterium]HIK76667.1 preprotein translocase subunit SecA [Gammaproteobacteria bacterium]
MKELFKRIFGSSNQRLLNQYSKIVHEINALEDEITALNDSDLLAKTDELKSLYELNKDLDSLLPMAFAVVREASKRTIGLRHYDVQLIGGLTLHHGKISEMKTGEGKTLVSTLPAYLNSLSNSVHIVTVNEYLAERDAEWMKPIYEFLGLTVGCIKSNQNAAEKKAAYQCDITYGTNNEFGFDYLRDNLSYESDSQSQGKLTFAIVDEVDSILIDEARTPLIISGQADQSTELYQKINTIVNQLNPAINESETNDYTIDEKTKQIYLTEKGHANVETILMKMNLLGEGESLYDPKNIRYMHHINAAIRAHKLFNKDVDYIVKDGEVIIVDEFTGRTMAGRRWSDGLHQAVEAKESLRVKEENQTIASITFQNYFRLYDKLSGMTGTADTEAFEFQQIYGLEVVVIPTDEPMIRDDQADLVYLNRDGKFNNIIKDIKNRQENNQPILVGTASIENSEYISSLLNKEGIKHEVLNAKQHKKESTIIAQAGKPGVVTIATNMAGRGTDIVLGGNFEAQLKLSGDELSDEKKILLKDDWQAKHDKVIEAGGLHIIGTERHESRRIDNQLRGRAGRQGDPGSSRFYLSLDDDLLRIFGDPEKTQSMLSRVGMEKGEAIESNLLTRQIERAQRKVESHNYDMRKNLLEYDDVANDQRAVIYQLRNDILTSESINDMIEGISEEAIQELASQYIDPDSMEDTWDLDGLSQSIYNDFMISLDLESIVNQDDSLNADNIWKIIYEEFTRNYSTKENSIGERPMREIEKAVMLQQLDMQWREHLAAMDHLRQGIHLRGYAQKNPKQEYKRESFEMFSFMMDQLKFNVISILSRARFRGEEDAETVNEQMPNVEEVQLQHKDASIFKSGATKAEPEKTLTKPFIRAQEKIGRNEPCPCGSGKKYKKCHGVIEQ